MTGGRSVRLRPTGERVRSDQPDRAFESVVTTLPFAIKILYNFPVVFGIGGFIIILGLYARQGGGGHKVPR